MGFFDSPTLTAIKKQMEAAEITQSVIANNMANANTPGFKKSTVSFADELKNALNSSVLPLRTSHPRHISNSITLDQVKPRIIKEEGTTMGYNNNNVDVEQEMVNLAVNSLSYQAAARMLDGKLTMLGYVIRGR